MTVLATVGIVTIISALLILGGIGLFGLTVWFWKTSRPEPPALARLEIMSERAWRKSRGVDRQFLLKIAHDAAREGLEDGQNTTSAEARN